MEYIKSKLCKYVNLLYKNIKMKKKILKNNPQHVYIPGELNYNERIYINLIDYKSVETFDKISYLIIKNLMITT